MKVGLDWFGEYYGPNATIASRGFLFKNIFL